jgi:glycosyltransferase involved in cell wall biosynthesis
MRNSVLMIGNFLSATGGSRGVCEELAERLVADGWGVLCASRKRSKFLRLADMVLTAVKKRHEYAIAQVDVFSGPAFFWAEAACWTLRRLGKPYALTLHGGNLPEFAAKWPGRVRRFLRSAKAVTAPSPFLQRKMETYCPGIRVIPNAIDIAIYPYRQRGPARPKLIWLRSFHEIYNPVMAVKVLGALASKYPEVQLTMVGQDKGDGSFQRAQAEVAALGLQRNISCPGPVPKQEVPRALSGADILLNTTNFDNTPVSIIEAMACGLCIVSTNVGGLPYLLQNGHDALTVSPNDQLSMAAAVGRLLTDVGLAQRLSVNSRRTAEQFDWSAVLSQWVELLNRLAR